MKNKKLLLVYNIYENLPVGANPNTEWYCSCIDNLLSQNYKSDEGFAKHPLLKEFLKYTLFLSKDIFDYKNIKCVTII